MSVINDKNNHLNSKIGMYYNKGRKHDPHRYIP